MSPTSTFIARNAPRPPSRRPRGGALSLMVSTLTALLIALLMGACTRSTPTLVTELRTFDVVVSNTSGRSLRDAQVSFEGLAHPHGGTLVRRGERRKPAHHGPWPETARASWRDAAAGGTAERIEGTLKIPPLPSSLAEGQYLELRFEFDGEKVIVKVLPPA